MTSEADYAPLRFSTADLPERDRVALWHDVFGRMMLRVNCKTLSDGPFYTDATLRALPGLRTLSCKMSAVQYHRTRELVADGNNDVSLIVNLNGSALASQRGQEIMLEPGDATVIASADPATFANSRHHISIVVPSDALAPLVSGLDEAPIQRIPRNTEALRLLLVYLKALREDLMLSTPELRHAVVTHVHDLAALAIGATRDAAEIANARGARAARLRAIKAEIAANSGSRDLTVATVAQRHGITPRSVQMLFETESTTFSEYLLAQRLARAHRMLTDPRHAALGIGAIAFAAGFGDLSYFNRTFRRRYGVVPSDVRKVTR